MPQRQDLTCLFHPTLAHRTVLIGFLGAVGLETAHGRYGAGCQARQGP